MALNAMQKKGMGSELKAVSKDQFAPNVQVGDRVQLSTEGTVKAIKDNEVMVSLGELSVGEVNQADSALRDMTMGEGGQEMPMGA